VLVLALGRSSLELAEHIVQYHLDVWQHRNMYLGDISTSPGSILQAKFGDGVNEAALIVPSVAVRMMV
jgi:hypothetical protein